MRMCGGKRAWKELAPHARGNGHDTQVDLRLRQDDGCWGVVGMRAMLTDIRVATGSVLPYPPADLPRLGMALCISTGCVITCGASALTYSATRVRLIGFPRKRLPPS